MTTTPPSVALEPYLSLTSPVFIESLNRPKTDPELGQAIHDHLEAYGLENPVHYNRPADSEAAHRALVNGIRHAFYHMSVDLEDPSMQDTPKRFADMFIGELTKGLNYHFFPKCTATPALDDQMVLVRNCRVTSLCEHHLQTIDGYAHIAYIPNKKLLGLSKFARVVEFFSRRPQVQERLTAQIYYALSYVLETQDIAVVINATHYCMKARGALQDSATTQTDKMGGKFLSNPTARGEFFDAIRTI